MKLFRYCLALSILVTINAAFGQDFNSIELSKKVSILNDRVFLNFPDAAENIARQVNIMSADHNINKETRIIYDIGSKRLVFFAQELFRLGTENLFETVSNEEIKGMDFEKKVLTDKESLLSILLTPTVFDSTENAILVNRLLVRTQDNSLLRIDAYINPEAYSDRDNYLDLTERVFKTISKGNRTNTRVARTEKIKIFDAKKSFEFDLPENYSITVDQKYDFQVYNLHKYVDYSDTNWVSLTIYTGHHPSFFH